MPTSRPRSPAAWILLVGLWALAGATTGCGGGGSSDGSGGAGTATVRLKNNGLTKGGLANTHVIVGYTYSLAGQGGLNTVGPLTLAPSATTIIQLPVGSYLFTATYDDGHNESLQIPPDQVLLFSGTIVDLTFLY